MRVLTGDERTALIMMDDERAKLINALDLVIAYRISGETSDFCMEVRTKIKEAV
jgi:hypothetical protein